MCYKDEFVVVGYGVFNEFWGIDVEIFVENVIELYYVICEVDIDYIVILLGYNSGIDVYGDLKDVGMINVVFEMYFYLGIFGWGEIGYDVYCDWLICGQNGIIGVCEWDEKICELDILFLIGEMQFWIGLGEEGGVIICVIFDCYNELSWVVIVWFYKVMIINGGQGNGIWGYVINKGECLFVKVSIWSCVGWDIMLFDVCEILLKVVMLIDID